MVVEISLSIEETNKLRAQLGLRLLPTTSSETCLKTGLANHAGKNYDASISSLGNSNPEFLRESLDPRQLDSRTGTGSLKSDSKDTTIDLKGVVDTGIKNGNHEKKMNKELQEKGDLRVGHSAKQLAQVKEGQIFILEDQNILDDDDDCFVNDDLLKRKKQESNDRERRKMGQGSMVPDYMEDIEAEEDLDLIQVVGSTIRIQSQPVVEKPKEITGNITKLSGLFDDLDDDTKPQKTKLKAIKFKKGKSKSSSKKRSNEANDEISIISLEMVTLNFSLEDEDIDSIEASLAVARRNKTRSRSRMTPEQIAEDARMNARLDELADLKDGLVFDHTSDLLNTISAGGGSLLAVEESISSSMDSTAALEDATIAAEESRAVPEVLTTVSEDIPEVVSQNVTKNSTAPSIEAINTQQIPKTIDDSSVAYLSTQLKRDVSKSLNEVVPGQEDTISTMSDGGTSANQSIKNDDVPQTTEDDGKTLQRPKLGSLLAALKYLRQNSKFTSDVEKAANKLKREKEKEQNLIRIKISIQERLVKEELEQDISYTRQPAEEQQKTFDRVLSERLVREGIISDTPSKGKYNKYASSEDDLKDYNPQVHIRHKDEMGKILDQKQAWKALSHRYHGLAPKNPKRAKH